jgi:predicted nucleotidyltransferase
MDRFEELREKIVPLLKPYVKRVAVFGSFAHGEDTPDSDIDLLVALKPSGERPPLGLNWFGLWAEIEQRLGRKVDLVTEDALSPYIRPDVEREQGGVVCGREMMLSTCSTYWTAVERIEQYTAGMTEQQFLQNSLVQDAVARQLEIIGEASRNLSDELRQKHSQVP